MWLNTIQRNCWSSNLGLSCHKVPLFKPYLCRFVVVMCNLAFEFCVLCCTLSICRKFQTIAALFLGMFNTLQGMDFLSKTKVTAEHMHLFALLHHPLLDWGEEGCFLLHIIKWDTLWNMGAGLANCFYCCFYHPRVKSADDLARSEPFLHFFCFSAPSTVFTSHWLKLSSFLKHVPLENLLFHRFKSLVQHNTAFFIFNIKLQ